MTGAHGENRVSEQHHRATEHRQGLTGSINIHELCDVATFLFLAYDIYEFVCLGNHYHFLIYATYPNGANVYHIVTRLHTSVCNII